MIGRLSLGALVASNVRSISHIGGSSVPADEFGMNFEHEELNIQAKHSADASVDYDNRHQKVLAESALENGPPLPIQTAIGMKSFNTTRPVVCAAVDPFSWLSYEFPMGITRNCPRSQCRVNVDQHHGSATSAMYFNTSNGSTVLNACDATVYLTSFTPNEVVLPASLRNHINAVVFMENDPRYIRGEDIYYHKIIRMHALHFLALAVRGYQRRVRWLGIGLHYVVSFQHVWTLPSDWLKIICVASTEVRGVSLMFLSCMRLQVGATVSLWNWSALLALASLWVWGIALLVRGR